MKPTVINKMCPAMKDICTVIAACSTGAIQYVADAEEPLGGRIVIDEARCDGCGKCVTVCCGHAIVME